MLDKINDLKRMKEEQKQSLAKVNQAKFSILSECKEILDRAELSRNDIYDYMTPF